MMDLNKAGSETTLKLEELLHQNGELKVLVDILSKENESLKEKIASLTAEVEASKKLPEKPKYKASKLNEEKKKEKGFGKRAGSEKRSKKAEFEVDEEKKIEPEELPEGAKLHQYRQYDVQEISIERRNIRFLLGEYDLPSGERVRGELPPEYRQTGHFGPTLVSHMLYEHYQNRVPQTLIKEQLEDWGVEISVGQINRILNEGKEKFHQEQAGVLRVGIVNSSYVHSDDTGAKHQGKNGYTTVIGNELFSYFHSSGSKSRENFLQALHGGSPVYVLNEEGKQYLESDNLAQKHRRVLSFSDEILARNKEDWSQYLEKLGINSQQARRRVSEAGLLGGLCAQGVSPSLRVLSDGARQFCLFTHALCWVHAERGLRKLSGSTTEFRDNIETVQTQLWEYYQELKAYRENPQETEKIRLGQHFDAIFGTDYPHHPCLNLALAVFRDRKQELLRVLDFPDLPLHNNAAETDIREYVTRRKISGGTRSDSGRRARDTFVGLKKTCRKLGISFWHFLCSRFRGDSSVLSLPDILCQRILQPPTTPLPVPP
jgi:hypothetical protein